MSHNLYSNDETSGLQSSVHGLHVTPSAPLPFLSGVVVRAFVLERSQGNIILYNDLALQTRRAASSNWGGLTGS